MTEEYIIISKTAIEKRIEELEYLKNLYSTNNVETFKNIYLIGELKEILFNSIPLEQEIEKAFDKGLEVIQENSGKLKVTMPKAKQDYITQLKLDI